MTAVDSIFEAATGILMDLDGYSTTVLRPHSVKRADRQEVASLTVKTQALVGASSLVLHVYDTEEKRASGKIPGGAVLVHDGNNYTVQAEAEFSGKQVTVSISPVLASQANVGDSVTLPNFAEYSGFTRLESSVGAFSASQKFEAGTRVLQIKKPDTLPTGFSDFVAGEKGDLVQDATSSETLGRISRITDNAPDATEVVLG